MATSKRAREGDRMTFQPYALLTAVTALLALTFVWVADTPQYLLHERGPTMVLVYVVVLFMLLKFNTAPTAVIAGGVAANMIDALNGSIEDPFVVIYGGHWVAFNFADMFIISGLVLVFVSCARRAFPPPHTLRAYDDGDAFAHYDKPENREPAEGRPWRRPPTA